MTPLYDRTVALGFVWEAYVRRGVAASGAGGQQGRFQAVVSCLLVVVLATGLAWAPAAGQGPVQSTRFDGVATPLVALNAARVDRGVTRPPETGPDSFIGSPQARPRLPAHGVVPTTLWAVIGTGVGAVGGTGIGLLVGAVGGDLGGDDGGAIAVAAIGGLVGAGVGMPVGAHIGNDRRGILVADILVGALTTGAASWYVLEHARSYGVIIPVSALVGVVATELITGR